MRKTLLTTAALSAIGVAATNIQLGLAQQSHSEGVYVCIRDCPDGAQKLSIKTRLDHFAGTQWVLVVSYLQSEITSITCDTWTMLGIKSWHDQNDFTIPAGPTVAVMDAKGFNGYCKSHGSIVAHTDDGDFVGTLDRGDGNWDASTKLTFQAR